MNTSIQSIAHNVPDARALRLAELARQALVAEAELTPKPGLVDRRGSGSHDDLSLDLMRHSALAIAPYFARMSQAACCRRADAHLRERLATIGRDAERAMLRATGGVNTHRGAIWSLGLLLSAHSLEGARDAQTVARNAGALARLPDRLSPRLATHGERVRHRYGVRGAYGEACEGFPHVLEVGLPALRNARQARRSESSSRMYAFLYIAARLDDTCVLYRGGRKGLSRVKRGAHNVLQLGGPDTVAGAAALHAFGCELVTHHLSPGGSADLLAATLLLDAMDAGRDHILADDSRWEESDGMLAV